MPVEPEERALEGRMARIIADPSVHDPEALRALLDRFGEKSTALLEENGRLRARVAELEALQRARGLAAVELFVEQRPNGFYVVADGFGRGREERGPFSTIDRANAAGADWAREITRELGARMAGTLIHPEPFARTPKPEPGAPLWSPEDRVRYRREGESDVFGIVRLTRLTKRDDRMEHRVLVGYAGGELWAWASELERA